MISHYLLQYLWLFTTPMIRQQLRLRPVMANCMQRTRTVVTWCLVILLYWCHPSDLITISPPTNTTFYTSNIFPRQNWEIMLCFMSLWIIKKLNFADFNSQNHIRLYQGPSSKVSYPSLMIKVIIYRLKQLCTLRAKPFKL